jgi:hypothetical protein
MYGRLFPNENQHVANSLWQLALTLAKLDRLPDALINAQKGAAMAHRILPEGHPVRKKCDETLAEIKKQIEAADAASEVARPKSSPP